MTPLQVYTHCQSAAGGLLSAIDGRDLRRMEDSLMLLRGILSARDQALEAREDRLYQERLDALEGVTEELSQAVRKLQQPVRVEFQRIEEAAPLLRHLTGDRVRPARRPPCAGRSSTLR